MQSVKAEQASVWRDTEIFLKWSGIRDRFTKSQVHQGKRIGAQGCPTAYYLKKYDFSFVGMLELGFFFLLLFERNSPFFSSVS